MALSIDAYHVAKVGIIEGDLKAVDQYYTKRLGNRLVTYINFSKGKLRFCSLVACEVLKGVAVGAGAGLVAGAAFGGAAGGVAAIPSGAKLGAKVGMAVGGIIQPIRYVVSIERSNIFRKWLADAVLKDAFSEFQQFCDEDEEISDLLCMISSEFPVDPVRAPDGKVYEREAITKWLATNPNNPSPIRAGGNFTAADLVPAPDHLRNIMERMSDIYRKRICQMSADDIRREGFEQFREAFIKDYSAGRGEEFRQLLAQHLTGNYLNEQEYQEKVAEITRHSDPGDEKVSVGPGPGAAAAAHAGN